MDPIDQSNSCSAATAKGSYHEGDHGGCAYSVTRESSMAQRRTREEVGGKGSTVDQFRHMPDQRLDQVTKERLQISPLSSRLANQYQWRVVSIER